MTETGSTDRQCASRSCAKSPKLTPEQIAAKTGVSVEDYLSYESGTVDIPISFLLKLSQCMAWIPPPSDGRFAAPQRLRADAQKYGRWNRARASLHLQKPRLLFQQAQDRAAFGYRQSRREQRHGDHSHTGHEFDYVLEGVLSLKVGDQDMLLEPGDSAYYDSIHPHAMPSRDGRTWQISGHGNSVNIRRRSHCV
jgi:mannose-6-phosphate isomerase-like protein (cupin superfamily)